MITSYNEFNFFKLFENLINESKLTYTKRFIDILTTISNNKIAQYLLDLKFDKIEADYTQNYIDMSDGNNSNTHVVYIPDKKAQKILDSDIVIKWITIGDSDVRKFTYNKNKNGEYKNRHLFDALGFIPPEDQEAPPIPSNEIGIIVAETVSKVSGKHVVWFKTDKGIDVIINKDVLSPRDDRYDQIWNLPTVSTKIGRLARALLLSANKQFTTSDIEEFTNLYKSTVDVMNDEFIKFELVSGKNIAHWYYYNNYESDKSSLGSSCMANVNSEYFDIYVYNKNVQLLILYSKSNGSIVDNKYKSNKIRGRAIVWTLDDGSIFMDRIYTHNDSDIELFKKYAENNGWFYKLHQDMDAYCYITNGKESSKKVMVVNLENTIFDYYPYLDTMCFLSDTNKIISNRTKNTEYELKSTDGDRYETDDY